MIKAIAKGVLTIGSRQIDCYVLEGGIQVISSSGMQAALGVAKGRDFRRTLSRIGNENNIVQASPIHFTLPDGRSTAHGYKGELLVQVCRRFSDLLQAGELHPSQVHMGKAAYAIISSLAGVAINALINEATKYQEVVQAKQSDYLQQQLQRLLREEAGDWSLVWSQELVREICRLWGWRQVGSEIPRQMSGIMRHIYDAIIGREIMREVKSRNPSPEFNSNHHQWLTDDVKKVLIKNFDIILVLARQSTSGTDFLSRVRFAFKRTSFFQPPLA